MNQGKTMSTVGPMVNFYIYKYHLHRKFATSCAFSPAKMGDVFLQALHLLEERHGIPFTPSLNASFRKTTGFPLAQKAAGIEPKAFSTRFAHWSWRIGTRTVSGIPKEMSRNYMWKSLPSNVSTALRKRRPYGE